MAGILDSKNRIMDVIITQEGRRQISSGRLRAEFISFTDSQAFYEKSLASGSTDASDRIYFEATSKLQDSIVMETDDSGNLMQFDFSPKHTLIGEQLFTVTTSQLSTTNYQFLLLNTGSSFASVGNLLVTASINNFKNQLMIGTRNGVNSNLPGDGFDLNKNSIDFTITNYTPFANGAWDEKVNIDSIEPLFLDKRLSHLPNFKFLPPVTSTGEQLGNYPDLNEKAPLTYTELLDELGIEPGGDLFAHYRELNPFRHRQPPGTPGNPLYKNYANPEGLKVKKEKKVIRFKSTSRESNVVMQMFELNNSAFTKLDIIDFGIFNDMGDKNGRVEKHTFFAGKVYIDDNGMSTFVNLFTIIMD